MSKRPMFASEYPLECHGFCSLCNDWCRIIRNLLHGTTVGTYTYIGDWCEVETYPDNDRYVVPRNYLHWRTA